MTSPVLVPVLVLVEPVAYATASSANSAARPVSTIGTPLLEVQPKKASFLCCGGGPFTKATEQPPEVAASQIAAQASERRPIELRGRMALQPAAREVPIVIGGTTL
jgi:hypothetical protein